MKDEKTTPLLKSGLTLELPFFFAGRICLYTDRIVCSGWSLQGAYRQVIQLEEVEAVQWWTHASGPNLGFRLKDGQRWVGRVPGAANWKFTVDELLADAQPTSRPALPCDPASVSGDGHANTLPADLMAPPVRSAKAAEQPSPTGVA